MTDIAQAAKYEEFLANVNRRYIENLGEVLKEDILEIAQKRADELRAMWTTLRMKYNELDALMGKCQLNVNGFFIITFLMIISEFSSNF